MPDGAPGPAPTGPRRLTTRGAAIAGAVAAPLACAGPAWAEVCDKMGPSVGPFAVVWIGALSLAWLVGLAERRLWLSLPPATLLAVSGWLHLADRLALARDPSDPATALLAAAIREGCRTASQGPSWLLIGMGVTFALVALVDRVQGRRG